MGRHHVLAVLALPLFFNPAALGQTRFQDIPGYERYQEISSETRRLAQGGRAANINWSEDGSSVVYNVGGQWFEVDLNTLAIGPGAEPEREPAAGRGNRGGFRPHPGRGRQRLIAPSPDGAWTAKCEDWNLVIENNETDERIVVTKDGNQKLRYATANWVYGEELSQNDAMWWSPDSKKIVFYKFNEGDTPDYYLISGLTDINTELIVEGYPKAGAPNPVVGLQVYDMESDETTDIQANTDPEQYIYNIRFSPDGSQVLFNRTNRHQNFLEVVSADPNTGKSRLVVSERQDTFQKNSPMMRFLADGKRFIWETEASQWKHYELRDLDGRKLATLTRGNYPCANIVQVDEKSGWMYYFAFSDKNNPLNQHLHRVKLDGSGHQQLTRASGNHTTASISPDHKWVIATHDSVSTPPETMLYQCGSGRSLSLAKSDLTVFNELGLETPELFTYMAGDGETRLYGTLYKPSNFDPNKSYPLLVSVYGGPSSTGVRNSWRGANAICELGFLHATLENRGTVNRGKAFESATYLQLGTVDIMDQAEGVKELRKRPYVDGSRVGIYGGSYGGYMAALAVLRYPDVFQAAVASAAVTDWRNYDTIYTERYMRTPLENTQGYDAGSCMTYAENLRGDLLILHGMVDDNVHPSNAFQLVDALHKADKRFDLMMFPNNAHGLGRHAGTLRWEYFYEHLIEDHQNN